jgi:penicillin-binding protein 1A
MENIKKSTIVQISLLFGFSLIFGGILGWGLSETRNIENSEYITQFDTALPTKLLDINGEVITELASDEKREIISLEKLPQLMIDALLTREDRIFYEHRGFSCKAVTRAFLGKILHLSLGGGSTLTQQIAGTLYCDRTDMTIWRKIKELWWAVQMERRCSKSEILETYLNRIYFGGGTYGVNAASKYYFGHSATEITPAEAAILVIQLSNPAYYNPFDHPNRAMERQHDVLNSMVKEGFISKADADDSFDTYWANFDYTRTSSSAYFMRDDKAPWFSEYVRRELGSMIYGAEDIYTSGFTVNTTLDLSQQDAASDVMSRYIAYANKIWKREQAARSSSAFKTYVPLSELISLVFNLPGIKVSKERSQKIANETFVNRINPIIDVCSMMFGLEDLKVGIVNKANTISKQEDEKTTIEGTMITLQNDTGYITALVGGSKYDQDNQLIRAVQSKLQPGSTFKPLYYSAAIDSRKFTPATEISDTPVVFHKADGTPYIPQNFKGEWQGNVQLWYALAHSMNVPSLKVLDGIGFDAAIERTSALLGIPKNELADRHFLPVYPFGLGVCSVRPIEMARAFAIFANSGKEVTPMAIRTVEDRNGNVVLNPELDIRKAQQAKGSAIQIISPQTAYVMTQMLENTAESGTLAGQGSKLTYRNDKGRSYTIPLAGKTGTTQNWADAWTVAYSPYYTSAFWFGFDKPGNSLGLHITGATLAGIAMGEYMGKIHKTLPYKDFAMPASGVVKVTICTDSGLLPTPECGNHIKSEWFLAGTEPTEVCNIHTNTGSAAIFYDRYEKEMYKSGQHLTDDVDTSPLKLDLNFLNDNSIKPAGNSNDDSKNAETEPVPDYNYLMD